MCLSGFDPYLADLGIATLGGLVSTGIYLAYQRWLTGWSSWPFPVEVVCPANGFSTPPIEDYSAWVRIRNPTGVTALFDISYSLVNGENGYPSRILAADPTFEKITGWAAIRPNDAREFQVEAGEYGSRIVGVRISVYGPFLKRKRDKIVLFNVPYLDYDEWPHTDVKAQPNSPQ